MRLLRSSAVVGGLTMVSRILGFIREMLFARLIGAGPTMDVFLTAFQFPNLFRRIFAEGAFNSAFVPLYSGKLEDGELTEAQEFARQIASVLFTAMLVFVVAAQIGMPWLMYVIGPGFVEDPGLFQRAVQLTQITMPYLLMMSLSAMFSGVLNAHGKFAVAAAAPVLLNLTLIGIMMFSDLRGTELTLYLSIGITASGVIQTAWIFAAMRHVGVRLSVRLPRLTPDVKALIRLGVPGAIAAGVTQINILITSAIATFQPSARSWLYYADRLYQLPLGVVGIAMGVVLLPTLSARLNANDTSGAGNALNRGIEISMALTIPAAVAIAVMPGFLVEGLFQREAFTATDTIMVGRALIPFAIGLPAFVLIKVLSPGFFARKDTITPMRFATISVVVNLVLGIALFMGPLQYLGLAIATSVAGWVNTILLAYELNKRGLLRPDARLMGRLPRIFLAAAIMGGFLYWAQTKSDIIVDLTFDHRLAALLVVTGAGAVVYAVASLLTGALRPSEVMDSLRRG